MLRGGSFRACCSDWVERCGGILGVGHAVVEGLTDAIEAVVAVGRGGMSLARLGPVYDELLETMFLLSTE